MKKPGIFSRTRDINTLYLLLYKYISIKTRIQSLCTEISLMKQDRWINENEYNILKEHFRKQRPSNELHPEFFNNEVQNLLVNLVYWWPAFHCDQERKDFVLKMIHITKEFKRESFISRIKKKLGLYSSFH
jgi:hypothetical protein